MRVLGSAVPEDTALYLMLCTFHRRGRSLVPRLKPAPDRMSGGFHRPCASRDLQDGGFHTFRQLIDVSVTVIVFSVADLRDGLNGLFADIMVGLAAVLADHAGTFLAGDQAGCAQLARGDTDLSAALLPGWTGEATVSYDTEFTSTAGISTLAAVSSVGLQIHTDSRTQGFARWTLAFPCEAGGST